MEDVVNEETEVEEEVDTDVGMNEGVEGEATDFVNEDYIAMMMTFMILVLIMLMMLKVV